MVIEDEESLAKGLAFNLEQEGYEPVVFGQGPAALAYFQEHPGEVDLILLDLMLPGEDGLSLCRSVRTESRVPIIMLTAKGEEVDRVIGLEMGADDYLAKPFGSRELIARIRAVLRRAPFVSEPARQDVRYRFDRWVLDVERRELLGEDGVSVPLSSGEFDLLLVLVERPQRVLSREQLLDLARGRNAAPLDRSIDTQISRLRRKIERDVSEPQLIKTIWGSGYMFTPAVEPLRRGD